MFPAIGRRAGIAAVAIIAALVVGHGAGAQTPKPSPSPAPTPVAFSAHAHANVTVIANDTTYAASLQLGVAQRANLTRIDILSVKSDTMPLPPITVTAVLDRGANTITVWNDTTKQYRVQPFLPRFGGTPSPRPSASPAASPRPPRSPMMRGRSPFADLDVLALTIKLTGHTTTSGLPTTGLSFDLQVQRKADKAASRVTATTQLADDFAVFPMTFDASVEPGMVPFSAKLSYAVDDLTRVTPALDRFAVPAGYTEARSLSAVFFGRRSMPMGSPMPMPVASSQPSPSRSPSPR